MTDEQPRSYDYAAPWDRQVLIDGRWQPHPEIEAALRAQEEGPSHE